MFECVDGTEGDAKWKTVRHGVGSAVTIETFSLFRDANPYLERSTTNYIAVARMVFRGTSVMGTPSAIKALYGIRPAGDDAYLRIYDVTNGLVICEAFTTNDDLITMKDLGTLSNLSTAEAIWEIQLKKTRVSAVSIYY
jgi:hypothetical protein